MMVPTRIELAREHARTHDCFHAFISFTAEREGERSLAVKDLVDVAGMSTTGGALRQNLRPATADAAIVARLRESGYGVIGKTNLHEWALGPTSGNPHFGAVANPVDPSRVAGGSSGGSAAAVAAGLCDLAIGTDTGGSIRIPSALCGIAGLRPTFGRVSLDGVIPLAQSFDTVGPMAADTEALAKAMEIISREKAAPVPDFRSLRLAAPHTWIRELDETVAETWRLVGAGLPDVDDLPELERFIGPGLTILYTEAASNHEQQLRERPQTLGDDVRELMQRGLATSATEYHQAKLEVVRLRAAVDAAIGELDALVLPTTACIAPPIGADAIEIRDSLTCFTRPFGMTGHPVVSLPGPTAGLPVGIQLVGRHGQDAKLLAVARSLEAAWRLEVYR